MKLQILLTFLIFIPSCIGLTFISSKQDSRDVEKGEKPHSRYFFMVNNIKKNELQFISNEEFERYKNNKDYSFILPKETDKTITTDYADFCYYKLLEKTNDYYLYEVNYAGDTTYTSRYKVFKNNEPKLIYTKIFSSGNMFDAIVKTIVFIVIFNIILKIIRLIIEDRKLSQKPEDF